MHGTTNIAMTNRAVARNDWRLDVLEKRIQGLASKETIDFNWSDTLKFHIISDAAGSAYDVFVANSNLKNINGIDRITHFGELVSSTAEATCLSAYLGEDFDVNGIQFESDTPLLSLTNSKTDVSNNGSGTPVRIVSSGFRFSTASEDNISGNRSVGGTPSSSAFGILFDDAEGVADNMKDGRFAIITGAFTSAVAASLISNGLLTTNDYELVSDRYLIAPYAADKLLDGQLTYIDVSDSHTNLGVDRVRLTLK